MSAAQFQAAGLDKLSAEELIALNTWLREHITAAPSASTTAAANQGRTGAPLDTGDSEFSTRIIGEFRGWEGKTIFHLENGQVWQQTGQDSWAGVQLNNPTVIIKPGFMGSWVFKIDGYNTTTRVKRIR